MLDSAYRPCCLYCSKDYACSPILLLRLIDPRQISLMAYTNDYD
jgi:hypothetical protein